MIDGRGSNARGWKYRSAIYGALGRVEIDDQIEAIRQVMKKYPFLDDQRLFVYGWSYGGFAAALMAERAPEAFFKCAVSIAPVANFLYYEEPRMRRATEDKPSGSQLRKVLMAMFEQMRLQHEKMKTLFATFAPAKGSAVQEISKDQYDQLSKDMQMFVSDEEAGHTFAYWYKRYGPVIRDSNLPDSKNRDLILMTLDEVAYRKYADDILPVRQHEIDFETTVANLQKLFASKKTLIRRRYECLRKTCPPLTASYVPFRDYARKIMQMDEDALVKELNYTALKAVQFVAGL
ncbi:hypothetical protein ANCCAN_03117 [Ancylostoma caninum]|uniref:Uncharacterized protein n=1 Tax=Ancylostoma caninum TaxID=29170 RepID=A0A368H297_ANCCA|nr:hypothetical protein ANCCAN_03117 [Ancylostoma caninum]